MAHAVDARRAGRKKIARMNTPVPSLTPEYLTSRDWYEMLARVQEAASPVVAARILFGAIESHLRIESTLIVHVPRDEGPRLVQHRTDIRRRTISITEYLRFNYVIDPFYLALERCRMRGMLALSEVIEENFDQSEYYRTYYEAAGLIDEICFCSGDRQSGHVLLSLSRVAGQRPFSSAELAAARAIAPLVVTLLAAAWQDMGQEAPPAPTDGRTPGEFHRALENARTNFGRSLLTPREFDVLQHILLGHSVKLIAQKLDIAVETVKVHRKHIYTKLGIGSQAEVFSLFIAAVGATDLAVGRDPLKDYLRPRH